METRRKQLLGYVVAVIVMGAATAVLRIFGGHVNPTTVALAFLLIVLFIATAWGPKPAVVASLAAVFCFNYFFLPPLGTLHISDPHNWIALIAFLVTAVVVGQLSAREKRRAAEANDARKEIEHLYHELQDSFHQSSQAEALRQSERLKSALLDAVTHDLRTPLTSIKASVTTLLDDETSSNGAGEAVRLGDDGRHEMLEIINEEADRLDQFIEDLMELARIEAGELQLRKRLTPLDEIVLAAMKRAEPRTRAHRIELCIDQELPSVNVDERAMAEVVYVLLDNAVKYSAPRSVIRIFGKTDAGGKVRLMIEDDGPGIAVEERERVFKKFYRARAAKANGKSGSGMGLAIAQGIVEAHGGRIWIENAVSGTGARFIVELSTDSD